MPELTIPVGGRVADYLPDFDTHTVTKPDRDWYTCVHIQPDTVADCTADSLMDALLNPDPDTAA